MSLSAAIRRAGVASSDHADPLRAGRLAAAAAASGVGRDRVRAILLFASASHGARALDVARGAREHVPDAAIAVVGGSDVLSAEGDAEGAPAVRALALTVPCHGALSDRAPLRSGEDEEEDAPAALGRALGGVLYHERRRPLLVFSHPHVFHPTMLAGIAEASGASVVAGGGLDPRAMVAFAAPGRAPRVGTTLVLRLDGGVRARVVTSAGLRPLTEPLPVEVVDAGFIARLGGRRPLAVLEEAMRGRTDRPMVLAVLEPAGREADAASGEGDGRIVRAISGVDPSRGAIHVGDPVRVGDRLAFGALDAAEARRDLDVALRGLLAGLGGGVPVAALYVGCVARGRRPYGAPHADARALRGALGDVPFAGVRGSFEIASVGGEPSVLSYTGVVVMLYVPS